MNKLTTSRIRTMTAKLRRSGQLGMLLLLVSVALPFTVIAQHKANRLVEVKTNMTEAMVYADSVYIGRASDQYFTLSYKTKTLLRL